MSFARPQEHRDSRRRYALAWGAVLTLFAFVISSGDVTAQRAVPAQASTKASKKTAPSKRTAVASAHKKAEQRAVSKPTLAKPVSRPASRPVRKAPDFTALRWQIDAWEIRARAAQTFYALLEWKKYTRHPKLSTKKAFQALEKIRREKAFFALIEKAHKRNDLPPVLKRRVSMLYESLREYHLSSAINKLRTQIHTLTDKLNAVQASYRAMYKGKKTSNRDLFQVIRADKNRASREQAWRARAAVGVEVLKSGFMKLVRLRNAYAKKLGFPSFFHYRYHKLNLKPKQMWALYENLRKGSEAAFALTMKDYAKSLGLKQVMPWDRRYARYVRAKQVIDLDALFSPKRLKPLLFRAYREMGFDLKSLSIEMDLYPRPNKNQHAYCFDIDPPHDVRIMANLGKPGMRHYETLFHEMGHAVHGKGVQTSIRTFRSLPDEGFLNEGSANFFGNLVDSKAFFQRYLNLEPKTLAKIVAMKRKQLNERLYGMRWTLLWMYFERDLYTTHANSQDPTPQFWKRYQQFMGPVPPKAPPFWGMLIHFVSHPIYYQNYLLADLLAAQLHAAVKHDTSTPHILGNKRVAAYLRHHFFAHGRRYPWDELMRQMTGKSLSADAYLKSLRTAWE